MSTTAEVSNNIPQEVVPYDYIPSMSAGHCMVAKGIKGNFGAERAHDPTRDVQSQPPSHCNLIFIGLQV
jgi:hypothetical protein